MADHLSGGWLWLKDGTGKHLVDSHSDFPDHEAAVKAMLTTITEGRHLPAPDGVGRRLAHGGPRHIAPEMVTPELMLTLRSLIALAPLHLPGEIKGIDAVAEHYPGLRKSFCLILPFTAGCRGSPDGCRWCAVSGTREYTVTGSMVFPMNR